MRGFRQHTIAWLALKGCWSHKCAWGGDTEHQGADSKGSPVPHSRHAERRTCFYLPQTYMGGEGRGWCLEGEPAVMSGTLPSSLRAGSSPLIAKGGKCSFAQPAVAALSYRPSQSPYELCPLEREKGCIQVLFISRGKKRLNKLAVA